MCGNAQKRVPKSGSSADRAILTSTALNFNASQQQQFARSAARSKISHTNSPLSEVEHNSAFSSAGDAR
jgi:hypothetical protein